MNERKPDNRPRPIARREFARTLGMAALASGLAAPLPAALAAQAAAAPQPATAAAPANARAASAVPGTAMPAVPNVPGMTADERVRVRGVIERDAQRRLALHTPPLAYDLEPAFLFRARPPARRRLPL
jgi:hypothetical protein